MSSCRFFVQLPVQSPSGAVMKQYYDCMPVVFICHEEKYAAEVVSAVSSAFASWIVPDVDEEWMDEQLLKLNGDPILNEVRPRKLYVFLRLETGQKTITTDYKHDILPLLNNPRTAHIPLRRVDTLAQALVFIMAKGDTYKLRHLGLEWAERRSSPRFQSSNKKPDVGSVCNTLPRVDSASTTVPTSALVARSPSDLPSGRKAPCCTRCREPMKGHSKSRCQKLAVVSLEAAIGNLSLNGGCDRTGVSDQSGPSTDLASPDKAHCFILSSEDIERVDETIAARGLKSRTIYLADAQSGEVAYIVARSAGSLEALATEVIKMSGGVTLSWLRVSSAAAIGAITAWASLAYL